METTFVVTEGFEVSRTLSKDGQRIVLFQVDLKLEQWHITFHHQTAGEQTRVLIHQVPDEMRSKNFVTREYSHAGINDGRHVEVHIRSRNSPGLLDENTRFPVLWVDGAYAEYSNTPSRPIRQTLENFIEYTNALMDALKNWSAEKVSTRKDAAPKSDFQRRLSLRTREASGNILLTASPAIAQDLLLSMDRQQVFDADGFYRLCLSEGIFHAKQAFRRFLERVPEGKRIFIDFTPISQCIEERQGFYEYIRQHIDTLAERQAFVSELIALAASFSNGFSFLCLDVGFALVPMQKEHRKFNRLATEVLAQVSSVAAASFHLVTSGSGVPTYPLDVFGLSARQCDQCALMHTTTAALS